MQAQDEVARIFCLLIETENLNLSQIFRFCFSFLVLARSRSFRFFFPILPLTLSQVGEKILKEILTVEGLNVSAKNEEGDQPIHMFARYNALSSFGEQLESLLGLGANLNAQNADGKTQFFSGFSKNPFDLL